MITVADEARIEYSAKEIVDKLEKRIDEGFSTLAGRVEALNLTVGQIREWQATERFAQKNHVGEHKTIDAKLRDLARQVADLERRESDEEAATTALQRAHRLRVDWRRYWIGAVLTVALVVVGIRPW